VLFVGEALVGNEAVDQLVKFNQALADYSGMTNPHQIDGIVLTKFDTIDDKVGNMIRYITLLWHNYCNFELIKFQNMLRDIQRLCYYLSKVVTFFFDRKEAPSNICLDTLKSCVLFTSRNYIIIFSTDKNLLLF